VQKNYSLVCLFVCVVVNFSTELHSLALFLPLFVGLARFLAQPKIHPSPAGSPLFLASQSSPRFRPLVVPSPASVKEWQEKRKSST